MLNPMPNPNSENVKVRFSPTAVGRFTATLTWSDASGIHRIKCLLQGNGIRGGN